MFERLARVSNPVLLPGSVFPTGAESTRAARQRLNVALPGHVTRPALKAEAERVVKKIDDAGSVENGIEILPLFTEDNRLRLAPYQGSCGHTVSNTYALRAIAPIRIIVKTGDVAPVGTAAQAVGRSVAAMEAQAVPEVCPVINHLQVETTGQK